MSFLPCTPPPQPTDFGSERVSYHPGDGVHHPLRTSQGRGPVRGVGDAPRRDEKGPSDPRSGTRFGDRSGRDALVAGVPGLRPWESHWVLHEFNGRRTVCVGGDLSFDRGR